MIFSFEELKNTIKFIFPTSPKKHKDNSEKYMTENQFIKFIDGFNLNYHKVLSDFIVDKGTYQEYLAIDFYSVLHGVYGGNDDKGLVHFREQMDSVKEEYNLHKKFLTVDDIFSYSFWFEFGISCRYANYFKSDEFQKYLTDYIGNYKGVQVFTEIDEEENSIGQPYLLVSVNITIPYRVK